MANSNTTEEQIRKAQRALGDNVPLTPDEQLAVANAPKGTSGGYTNTPAAAPIAGLDRVVVPTIQEKIAPVQPVVTNPYTDFIKTLQKPITPEEEARRERAARAVQGVAGLGNLMSAFANLTYTGKGAPSQTLPTQSVDAMSDKMTSWKDKLKAEREKYQAAELGAKTQQWKMEMEQKKYTDENARDKRNFDEGVRQFNKTLESNNKKFVYEQGQDAIKNEQTNKQIAIQQQNADTATKRADTDEQKAKSLADYRLWKQNGGGTSKDWDKPVVVKNSDGTSTTVNIRTNDIDNMNLQQILPTIPQEILEKHKLTDDIMSSLDKTAKWDEKVARAIGDALQDGSSETYQIMRKLGLIVEAKPQTVTENIEGFTDSEVETIEGF